MLARRAALSAATALLALAAMGTLTAGAPAAASTGSAPTISAAYDAGHHDRVPRIAQQWASAWNDADPQKMASLFTKDGTYEDFAFQGAFHGKEGVAMWVSLTHQSIRDAKVTVTDAFRTGDRVSIRWVFSGTDTGAFAPDLPSTGKSFAVPATTVMELRNGRIKRTSDYYNLADVLRQVGLPAGAYTPQGA
ncbi:SgcJ/EcaC family oxidoreductase [Streptomyces sp. NBC_01716]|uniref:SgcJ/EcaC family oxidoreductase n=1 Tax=Streptomyces sp. NBC_01716 TaxID=2975917 RepID=UPI002E2F1799|nr:SgcJ/EcaC family oxidoreductase [Streptomyces sp. NBC_01716]